MIPAGAKKAKPEPVAKKGDFALAGAAGDDVNELLDSAVSSGTEVLTRLTRKALERLKTNDRVLASGSLFTNADLQALADSIASAVAVGDLLGRSRLHLRMIDLGADPTAPEKQTAPETFAEEPNPTFPNFGGPLTKSPAFSGSIAPLPPAEAIRYFESLVPSLAVNPELFEIGIRREAFTLAVSTSRTLTENVKNVILENLKSGEGSREGAIRIGETLDAAGVSPLNSQYCEMVYRTNAINAYNTGAADELQSAPIVAEFFPVWEYIGIHDGRDRPNHSFHFGRYYPNSLDFATVRDWLAGKFDGYNCRCTFRPVSKYEWNKLQAAGATLSELPPR